MTFCFSRRCWLLAALLAFPSAYATMLAADPDQRGLPNFHRVNEHLYRGGQPTAAGLQELARRGVKTIVNLRRAGEEQSDREKHLVESLGMRYVRVPMRPLAAPSQEEVTRALSVVNDPDAWPVFVHCQGGRDRTGVVIACYRISQDRWSNEKALAEAREHGIRSQERAKQTYILSYPPKPPKAASQPERPQEHP